MGDSPWPEGFPVPDHYYRPYPDRAYGIDIQLPEYTAEEDQYDDDRTRNLESLYPYELLDPTASRPAYGELEEPIGLLRKEMVKKMEQDGESGAWNVVEFVPAWTDPDWGDRYIYTGPVDSDNPQVNMYVKPGILQKQRPALLPSDIASRGASEAAKRFGIDPAHREDPFYGQSGVTPTTWNFQVPLGYPRVTPSNQGDKDTVDDTDLNALAKDFENAARLRGEDATEDNFQLHLENLAAGIPSELVEVDPEIAGALLAVMKNVHKREEQEEYQRILFAGNTSNELVESNVWTLGEKAVVDLHTPLHELVTPDKWEITSGRGRLKLAIDGDTKVVPRTVYNISGQQGEYCMSNHLIRAALQPTLQLVSKILWSGHPITWAWADIYRMRPVLDARRPDDEYRTEWIDPEHLAKGVTQQEWFSIWLGNYNDAMWYPEQRELRIAGFNPTRWVCEILKRTIQWEINAKYELGDFEENMGYTQLAPETDDLPFIIRISISADFIWPLLVKDYSEAEKASCSFSLAAIMLHELSHAMIYARQQMLMKEQNWLKIDSQWRNELNPRIIDNLITFGYRILQTSEYVDTWVFECDKEDFFEAEGKSEAGGATENQYFGGLSSPITSGYSTRFLDDLTLMGCLELWPIHAGNKGMPATYEAVPRDMILKFFTERFWTHDVAKWGLIAMKIWPQAAPKMLIKRDDFAWAHVERKFGRPARRWMKAVYDRMKHDDDHVILWQWLKNLTVTAVEPVMVLLRWRSHRKTWMGTDSWLWEARNTCSTIIVAAKRHLQTLLDEVVWWDLVTPLPLPDREVFRQCLNAMHEVHRLLITEASSYQMIALDYHRQTDQEVKDTIRKLFAKRVYTRLLWIHMTICDNCIDFLDSLDKIDPRVVSRLAAIPQLVDMLTTERLALRSKFLAIQDLLYPVLNTFDPDEDNDYVFKPEDYPGVASAAALDMAKRTERMAKRQLNKLSGPARTVAQGWLNLLADGERFRDAVPGSPEDEANQSMDEVANYIDGLVTAQKQAVESAHPVVNEPKQVQSPVLQANQVQPNQSERSKRFVTAPHGEPPNAWQTLYAETVGFVPYEDPETGFTRFDRANIPNEFNEEANPNLARYAADQGQRLVGALGPGAVPSGIAAPTIPGVNLPNIGGQLTNIQASAISGLGDLINMRAATNPFAAAQQPVAPERPPAPTAQPASFAIPYRPAAGVRQAGVSGLEGLIQARAEQLQANPELAGRVQPAAFGEALQNIAGPSGVNLTQTNVSQDSNLFGMNTMQKGLAIQQLEDLIRERAVGGNPLAQNPAPGTGQGADPGSQSGL